MSNNDHLLIFVNYWGLTFDNHFVSAMFHSPTNPKIADFMSKKLEGLCHSYELQYEKEEDYPGSVTYKVSGKLLDWVDFGKFFRQRVEEILSFTQEEFEIPVVNINYGESHGALDTQTASINDLVNILHSKEHKIYPPKNVEQDPPKSFWKNLFS